jgi:prepilin-type N-terminal cleavage/methylation domain-containing protein
MTCSRRHATPRLKRKAFTLAELLISLAILGVIATFTIPKILNSFQKNQWKNIFKEDIATLTAIQTDMMSTYPDGTGPSAAEQRQFYQARLNVIKYCYPANNGNCWDPLQYKAYPYQWETGFPGVIFHNGSNLLSGFGNSNATGGVLDANGPSGPNQFGEDQLLIVTISNANYASFLAMGPSKSLLGVTNNTAFPSADRIASNALWESLWK